MTTKLARVERSETRKRYQPRQKGEPMIQFTARFINELKDRIEAEANEYGVSEAFVIANALAWVFDVHMEEHYTEPRRKK